MKGLRIWVMTEIQYDEYGNATVLRSFSKIARDSPIKQGAKKKAIQPKSKSTGVKQLWD